MSKALLTRTPRVPLLLLCVAVALPVLGGCGGDSADEERLQAAQLEAKREAARQARAERQRQQRRETRELKQEIAKLKREGQSSSSAPASGGSSELPRAAGTSSCGGELYAGPNTSCAFAQNVQDAYVAQGRSGHRTVEVFSPANGRSYVMTCTGGSPHVCTGGDDASLYFP